MRGGVRHLNRSACQHRPLHRMLSQRNGLGADMAGGWARDGAVEEQIEASLQDELARMRAQKAPVGESLTHCAECEEEIPEARRKARPGVKLCIECQQERDSAFRIRGGINRRGSKDSQLR